MIPKMKASRFVKTYSVTFVQPHGRRSQPFYFYNRYDRETVALNQEGHPTGVVPWSVVYSISEKTWCAAIPACRAQINSTCSSFAQS